MKRRLWLLLLSSLGLASNAMALCTVSSQSGQPVPHVFIAPGTVINIDADAPADTSRPVATLDTPIQGYDVKFDNCHTGDLFGKSVLNLSNLGASYIFPTNIRGIGVKILWNNGAAFSNGNFPTIGSMDFTQDGNGDVGSWVYPANSYYRVEFYKTSDTLNLNPLAPNVALRTNTYAYNWVISDSPGNSGQTLQIGTVQINSTPSCNLDNSKTVDFGTVTSNMLASGATIEKPLQFSITCRTDYGTYSANASLSSESASSDGSFIKVKDSSGSSDTLAIRIQKSDGTDIKLDGSISDTLPTVASNTPAQFNWKAKLMYQPGAQAHPAEGNFIAHAEILLQVK